MVAATALPWAAMLPLVVVVAVVMPLMLLLLLPLPVYLLHNGQRPKAEQN